MRKTVQVEGALHQQVKIAATAGGVTVEVWVAEAVRAKLGERAAIEPRAPMKTGRARRRLGSSAPPLEPALRRRDAPESKVSLDVVGTTGGKATTEVRHPAGPVRREGVPVRPFPGTFPKSGGR